MFPPERIVCLTGETTEMLYLLGEEARIVGISGYTVRPPRARKEKPRVSAFISADVAKITALEPDLVLAFSDMQAEIVAELIRKGIAVHCFNQRSIAEILDMIRALGALVGAAAKADALASEYERNLERTAARAARFSSRPKVYFEEWDVPMISGIAWVSESIGIAGGVDVFAERSRGNRRESVSSRPATSSRPRRYHGVLVREEIPRREDDRRRATMRPGGEDGRLHEIKSALILQPGPAALTDGLKALEDLIAAW